MASYKKNKNDRELKGEDKNMGMMTSLFGKTGDGQEAKIVTIMNKNGMGI